MQALVRAFPPGADHPELALVRVTRRVSDGTRVTLGIIRTRPKKSQPHT